MRIMSGLNLCPICLKPSFLTCSKCRDVVYCSRDHQKSHWKIHKRECFGLYFKVVEDESQYHLVAVKSIPVGKTVFKEKPLLIMPGVRGQTCFGCHKPLSNASRKYCTSCGLPICYPACEKSELHKPECETIVKYRKSKVPGNAMSVHQAWATLFIRSLYLRANNKDAWSKFFGLKRCPDVAFEDSAETLDLAAKDVGHVYHYGNFTRDELSDIMKIFEANKYAGIYCEYVYWRTSFVEHNCNPNCYWDINDEGDMYVRACRDINEGENISISHFIYRYCYVDKPRTLRLRNRICKCQLCISPTEPESHLLSIKCPESGCCGYVSPVLQPNDSCYIWRRCETCQNVPKEEKLRHVRESAEYIDTCCIGDYNKITHHLDKVKNYLHPDHLFITSWKLMLFMNDGLKLKENFNAAKIEDVFKTWCQVNEASSPCYLNRDLHSKILTFAARTLLMRTIAVNNRRIRNSDRMMDKLWKNLTKTMDLLEKYEGSSDMERFWLSSVQNLKPMLSIWDDDD